MPGIEGAQRPFWMHQIVEYLVGILLLAASFQVPDPVVPAVLGALVILNAAMAKGPLSAFPMVGRRLHRWLDIVVIVALVVAAVQPVLDIDSTSRLLLGGVGFVLFFIWLNSDFTDPAQRKAAKQQAKAARRQQRGDRPASEELGRQAGRAVGQGMNAAKQWGKKLTDSQDDS